MQEMLVEYTFGEKSGTLHTSIISMARFIKVPHKLNDLIILICNVKTIHGRTMPTIINRISANLMIMFLTIRKIFRPS